MMRPKHLSGPGAGVQKYDLLTALSVAGLSGSGVEQTSMLRLIAVVTARYNWSEDDLTMGHREMAALWSVDERTAKRETKRLIEAGFLEIKRRGARGRVSSYRLCIDRIYALSEPVWTQVGPDFQSRMAGHSKEGRAVDQPKVVKVDFTRARSNDPQWEQVAAHLTEANPARFAAWYAKLRPLACEGGLLTLEAASSFALQYIQTHLMAELQAAIYRAYPNVRRVLLVGENRL
ncbi:hypothetical protein NX862_16505 [Rhodobacter sp. KR11]|uniref:DnaA N-terminal domain-containing protein n=1 Tax=Rhodobacter sp. KR11 TaxID=2974588 RepID=UPI00222335AD|nr:DnaA N-terminal domain-containing protein [Rhodobacter sp. KR11]MCW1920364.1 hypothetical protein [Rhodobacter sp. KR11]